MTLLAANSDLQLAHLPLSRLSTCRVTHVDSGLDPHVQRSDRELRIAADTRLWMNRPQRTRPQVDGTFSLKCVSNL